MGVWQVHSEELEEYDEEERAPSNSSSMRAPPTAFQEVGMIICADVVSSFHSVRFIIGICRDEPSLQAALEAALAACQDIE